VESELDVSMPAKPRPPHVDPVKELKARTREILLANAERRSARFNASFSRVGGMLACFRGMRFALDHPDRCRCQDRSGETTPHKHYPDAPFSCARGCGCRAYHPAAPEPEETTQ